MASASRDMDGQYVAYTFYRLDPAFRRLPSRSAPPPRKRSRTWSTSTPRGSTICGAYSTTGVRPDVDFFLWKITRALRGSRRARRRAQRDAARRLARDAVLVPRDDQGVAVHVGPQARGKIVPKELPYLVVYPFVKVRPWYSLPEEQRQQAMDEHIRIGREEFPGIHNHTTYSFGIDDQEFMTAFECDEPADFMHLMLRLRDTEASAVHGARHADLRRAPRADPRGARPARRRRLIPRRLAR